MPHHGQIASDEEVHNAGIEGAKGAINGAARWGIYTGLLGGALYFVSPLYRSFTFQFKVYIQMSGMTVGSILEADRRIRDYEKHARRWRKLKRDQEVWKRYEEGYTVGGGGVTTATAQTSPSVTIKNRERKDSIILITQTESLKIFIRASACIPPHHTKSSMIRPAEYYGVSVSSAFVCLRCRFKSKLQQLQRPTRQLSKRANASLAIASCADTSTRPAITLIGSRPVTNPFIQGHIRHASNNVAKTEAAAVASAKASESTPKPIKPALKGTSHVMRQKKQKIATLAAEVASLTELPASLPPPLSPHKNPTLAIKRTKRQELRHRQRMVPRVEKKTRKAKSSLIRKTNASDRRQAPDGSILLVRRISDSKEGLKRTLKEEPDVEHEAPDKEPLAGRLLGRSLKEALAAEEQWASMIGADLKLEIIEADQPPVPSLSRGLERVLFNSGVHRVRDPHTRVYNFDPDLEKLMSVKDFDFNSLRPFMPPSKDAFLTQIATEQKKKYVGSTSSMTGMLKHFHYLLSKWRDITTNMLSRNIKDNLKSYTKLNRGPDAIFLRWKNGTYAIDADKEFDSANVLSLMGKYMELLLTEDKEAFEKRRVGKSHLLTEKDRSGADSFHYSTLGDFVIRSQLDAQDKRLPGTGMFDLKTRAVLPIRMDTKDFEWGMGYELRYLQGEWESFEREYYDMIRSTMLKYSLQVRMGRMDGIFVAYHNIARIFGFQYISLEEMDYALHGQTDRTLGDQEFLISLTLLNKIFDRATEKFPEQTIRFHFETRETVTPFMYIFAEPVTDAEADMIQSKNKKKIEDWEKQLLGKQSEEELTAKAKDASAAAVGDVATFSPSTNFEQEVTSDILEPTGNTEEGTITVDTASTVTEQEEPSINIPETSLGTSSAPAPASDGTDSTAYESTADADTTFLSALPEAHPDPHKPLLAMVLTTKSQQNGRQVNRPNNLLASETWKLRYSLTDVAIDTRAHAFYEACKNRRSKLMKDFVDAESENDPGGDFFRRILKEKAAQGRTWRKEQDEMEAAEAEAAAAASAGGEPAAQTQQHIVDMSKSSANFGHDLRDRDRPTTTTPPSSSSSSSSSFPLTTLETQAFERAERQLKQAGLETWEADDLARAVALRMVKTSKTKIEGRQKSTISVESYMEELYGVGGVGGGGSARKEH